MEFVKRCVLKAQQVYTLGSIRYQNALDRLYGQLKLQNLQLDKSNIKVLNIKKSFLFFFRLDAEYYHPKYDILFEQLSQIKCKRLGNLIKVAEMGGFNVIASLWLSEAKVLLEYVKKKE